MNRKELWNRIGRQLIPNVGTLVLVLVLLWAQQAGALGFLSPTSSTSTTTISYQGRLADSGGTPVNDTVGMTFRIYNAATGGSPLWTETYPAVQISDGLFHVLLGSTTPLPNSLFSDNDTLYLGITVGADDEMAPREQLASAPWAIAAQSVKLPLAFEGVADGQTTIPGGGSVNHVEVGSAEIVLTRPGKIYAQCDMTLQPDSNPKEWVGLHVRATDGVDNFSGVTTSYSGTDVGRYTSWSNSGVIELTAGTWTIQCGLHRSGGSGDPVVHTYNITAFQIE